MDTQTRPATPLFATLSLTPPAPPVPPKAEGSDADRPAEEVNQAEPPVDQAAGDVVTPKQLREVLRDMSFDDDKLTVIRSLAPRIADKGGAARVIAQELSFDDAKAEGIEALNGRQAVVVVPRTVASDSFESRAARLVDGLLWPVRQWLPFTIGALVAAYLLPEVGVNLGQIPGLNFLASISGTTGEGANVIAAFTGAFAGGALVGVAREFRP